MLCLNVISCVPSTLTALRKPAVMAVCSLQGIACVLLQVAIFNFGGSSARIRHYYIAALEKDWNYAPTGFDMVKGVQLEQDR